MTKPVVHYSSILHPPRVGYQVIIVPVDHYSDFVSNTSSTSLTSPIVAVFEDGEFETRNTIYKPL